MFIGYNKHEMYYVGPIAMVALSVHFRKEICILNK